MNHFDKNIALESLNMMQARLLSVNGMLVVPVFGMQFNLLHSTWSIIIVISGKFSNNFSYTLTIKCEKCI